MVIYRLHDNTVPTLRLIFLFYLVGLIEHFKVRPTKLNGRKMNMGLMVSILFISVVLTNR